MPYLFPLTWVANETTLDILSCRKQQVILNVKSDSEFTNSISCYERNRPVWIPWLQQKRRGSAAYIFQRLFCMGVSKKSSPLIRVASLLFAWFDTNKCFTRIYCNTVICSNRKYGHLIYVRRIKPFWLHYKWNDT